jgi:5-hydroxyisourate hydrolase
MSATLTTHILDTARGVPAGGVLIVLYRISGTTRSKLATTLTNEDGRTDRPLADELEQGIYELVFSVGDYFSRTSTRTFFDELPIRFIIQENGHYHVPLLLAPWSFATYRGS